MRIIIDTDHRTLTTDDGSGVRTDVLYSPEAFDVLTAAWLKVGWQQKYSYRFTWLGRPIIQLGDDLIRVQEVIYRVRPDVIIETGVAHGGSLLFYASLCKTLESGRVIGIDIEIRPENRAAIEAHPLASWITLIEGSSTSPAIVDEVARAIGPRDSVLVLLDSCHSRAHVQQELEMYHQFVTPGSYIVATDGIMRDLTDVPNGHREWATDNPAAAAVQFAERHREFVIETPVPIFNESAVHATATYWPDAWLRRV